MADPRGNTQIDTMTPDDDVQPAARQRRAGRMALYGVGGLGVVLAGALAGAWIWRVDLVTAFIDRQLAESRVPARYRVVEVGAGRLVLADVSLGDARHPDATAGRVAVDLGTSGSSFSLASVTLDKVRVAARWRDGRLSLGRLDRLLNSSSGPSGLPNVELVLHDGQARLDSPAGVVTLAADGHGHLRDGFVGHLSLRAPDLHGQGCAGALGLDGQVTTVQGHPRLTGPLDVSGLTCKAGGLHLAGARIGMDARGDTGLDGGELLLDLSPARLTMAQGAARGVSGHGRLTVRGGRLAAGWTLTGQGVTLPGLVARELGVEGRISGGADLTHATAEGSFSGVGVAPDAATMATMAHWQQSAQGTFAAPLIARLAQGMQREGVASKLEGTWTLRRGAHGASLVLPMARWSGPRAHLDGSRLMVAGGGLTGNLALTGGDLPRVNVRVAPIRGGQSAELVVAPWSADGAAITVPRLRIAERDGRVEMAGQVMVSGPVPGGAVRDLDLPIAGDWSAKGGLVLGRSCSVVRYGGATAGSLELGAGALDLCPVEGAPRAMLAVDGKAIHWGATSPGVILNGTLSGEALHVTSGPVLLGERQADLRNVALTLGAGAQATRARLDHLSADLTGQPNGRIEGGSFALAALPLDVRAVNTPWRWADGALVMEGGSLTLADRMVPVPKGAPVPDGRYEPLVSRDVSARLVKGVFSAQGQVFSADKGRALGRVALTHDLGKGSGTLDATIDALRFDRDFQPEDLSKMTRGSIADASGALTGDAHIAWNGGRITSRGHVSTDGFDFAGAVGPVKGVKGAVTFTDLIGLVTAGDQTVLVGSINPGIEADNGTLVFALEPGHVLKVSKAEWPFLDGRMWLEPFAFRLGISEARRFTLDVDGISAARFLERMDMQNLSATGTFDGSLPLVFDDKGGHVVGGALTARAPGGTVAYVGALTYKDLTPTANYAFKALRDMRYQAMRIDMDGDLAGELVSRVELRGISQGKTASRNFITKQIGRLPIQFNVNVRAPFYSLIGSVRSMYDPKAIADPRSLGLVGADGRAVAPVIAVSPASSSSSATTGIQPSVSEHRP